MKEKENEKERDFERPIVELIEAIAAISIWHRSYFFFTDKSNKRQQQK